jgi:hypothetical protein
MSDQEFNFPTPPERREAKSFEPPPWERAAFEELARKKAEEQAEAEAPAVMAQAAAEAAVSAEAAEPPATGPGPEVIPLASVPEVHPSSPKPEVAARQAAEEDKPAKPGVDEATLIAMLADLREEEEPMARTFTSVGLFATFVTALVGAVLVLWGVVQLAIAVRRDLGPTGVFGGLVLMVFGALFVALAFWVGARTLRQRGVI